MPKWCCLISFCFFLIRIVLRVLLLVLPLPSDCIIPLSGGHRPDFSHSTAFEHHPHFPCASPHTSCLRVNNILCPSSLILKHPRQRYFDVLSALESRTPCLPFSMRCSYSKQENFPQSCPPEKLFQTRVLSLLSPSLYRIQITSFNYCTPLVIDRLGLALLARHLSWYVLDRRFQVAGGR